MTCAALASTNRAIEILRLHFKGANPTGISRSLGITRQAAAASLKRHLRNPRLVLAAQTAIQFEESELDQLTLENAPCSECHRPSNLCSCQILRS